VHLNGAGWNVIGATAPWLPGVAIGHNDRVAWDSQSDAVDTQDVYADAASRTPLTVFKDSLRIRGRNDLFEFNRETTRHGVIVASDREHDLIFTIRWSGSEPGGAGELGALALDRARSAAQFRDRLTRWHMPARRFVYQDIDGAPRFQVAALAPLRQGGEWTGWKSLDELPHGPDGRTPEAAVSDRDPVVFAHVLGVTDSARQRYNIGPLQPPPDPRTFRVSFDVAEWDRSRAINAPGQSESPASSHFADLARLWAEGGTASLAYSDQAVRAIAETTLTLVPPKK
jgi:acyl-homoserine lactone acylase PvdQ